MIIAPECTFWAPSSWNSINLNRNILSDSSHFPSTYTQGMHREQRFRQFFLQGWTHCTHHSSSIMQIHYYTSHLKACVHTTAYWLSSVGHEKYTCLKQLPISPHFPTHHQNKYTKKDKKIEKTGEKRRKKEEENQHIQIHKVCASF